MTRLVATFLATLFLFVCSVETSSATSASPEAVVGDFMKAWNTHDMKAFDALFTDDAIWVPVAEARLEGRTNIVSGISDAHATWAKETTVSQSAVKVQQLRPDVAVILFHMKFLVDGKEVPDVDRAMIVVAVKQSHGWKIASGQLTKQHDGA